MKKLLFALSVIAGLSNSFAQTTATDFTVNDCDGVSHNLFTELESGKVIVLVWVMPCAGCILPSQGAYNAAQSFATSHPGRVHFYMADDYANSTCASVRNWATTNNMPNSTFFTHNDINMSDYGTGGMPKIVVLAGADHKIYYNINNTADEPGVQAAIDSALVENPTTILTIQGNSFFPEIFPNPSQNEPVNIYFSLENEEKIAYSVYDAFGRIVKEEISERRPSGENNILVETGNYVPGIYFIYLKAGDLQITRKLVIN